MNTLASFRKSNRHINAAGNAFTEGVTWGGTGALGSMLLKHNSSKFQRNVSAAATLAGVGNSLRKSYLSKPKKPRIVKPRIKTIK